MFEGLEKKSREEAEITEISNCRAKTILELTKKKKSVEGKKRPSPECPIALWLRPFHSHCSTAIILGTFSRSWEAEFPFMLAHH